MKSVKIPSKALSDIKWFHKVHKYFSFSGRGDYFNGKGENIIQYSPIGASAEESFYIYDSRGIIVPTRQYVKLLKLHTTKASVNLWIKEYAKDRASGLLPRIEFEEFCTKIKAPLWFVEAVETQKYKYYNFKLDQYACYAGRSESDSTQIKGESA